ncbi:MAG: thioredoxin domain-containing protein [Planctomycetaceae bacterium]|nr:thioredoxin domain-containing protein [Planctomycetaceae bacterium]
MLDLFSTRVRWILPLLFAVLPIGCDDSADPMPANPAPLQSPREKGNETPDMPENQHATADGSGPENQAGSADTDSTKESADKSKPPTPQEGSDQARPKHGKGPANRLADETSPYLLLHAHNPVHWYPWGPEALEKARKEGKMIFLSIGYSSCYWCHVMERESFSDPEIAKFMNEHFINIKVDREERPDIDDIYMNALRIYVSQAGGGTGWPMSMFLTPDTRPVAGGTYFPPRDQPNRPPGFLGVLKAIHKLWTEDRPAAESNAAALTRALRASMRPRLVLAAADLSADLVETSIRALAESHDSRFGGISFDERQPDRPKFPTPPKLELLAYAAASAKSPIPEKSEKSATGTQEQLATRVLDHTLLAIADGGIHDQIGGGFHRYSTDRQWRVPHFEKMLYDNAQLADLYVTAFARTGNPTFQEVAQGVFTYVLRDMTDPDGSFYSAEDAETDAIEGKYYVWSANEIDQALGDGSILFRQRFGVVNKPDFEHGNVLFRAMPLDKVVKSAKDGQALAEMKKRLLAIRKKRDAPLRDDKVLTSWNGLMIRSLANGGRVLKRPDYIKAATRAADFLLEHLRDKKRKHLLRTYRKGRAKLNAYLVDYAFLVEGLLALHAATGEDRWLDAARQLTDEQIGLYWDKTRHGFYFTPRDHEELLARTQNGFDSVMPSGNSTSVRNLVRLTRLTGDKKYRLHARQTLEAFVPMMREQLQRGGMGMTHMALALAEFLEDEPKAEKPKKAPSPDKQKSD